MDYQIATAETTDGLTNKVKELLNAGWKCQGGVFVERYFVNSESKDRFHQALVKEEAE